MKWATKPRVSQGFYALGIVLLILAATSFWLAVVGLVLVGYGLVVDLVSSRAVRIRVRKGGWIQDGENWRYELPPSVLRGRRVVAVSIESDTGEGGRDPSMEVEDLEDGGAVIWLSGRVVGVSLLLSHADISEGSIR